MGTLALLREYAAVTTVLRDADAEAAPPAALGPLIRESEALLEALFPDGGPAETPGKRPGSIPKFGHSRRAPWRRLGARVTTAADVPWGQPQWGFGTKAYRVICEEVAAHMRQAHAANLDFSSHTFMNSIVRGVARRLEESYAQLASLQISNVVDDGDGRLTLNFTARAPSTIHSINLTGTVEV